MSIFFFFSILLPLTLTGDLGVCISGCTAVLCCHSGRKVPLLHRLFPLMHILISNQFPDLLPSDISWIFAYICNVKGFMCHFERLVSFLISFLFSICWLCCGALHSTPAPCCAHVLGMSKMLVCSLLKVWRTLKI